MKQLKLIMLKSVKKLHNLDKRNEKRSSISIKSKNIIKQELIKNLNEEYKEKNFFQLRVLLFLLFLCSC